MEIRETTLGNDLRVVTANMPGMRSATAYIMAGTGSRHENADNNGVSHWLEHLLFKGSKRYPTSQIINEAVDSVGGMNNAYTTEEQTGYYIKVPGRHLALALDILCDMVSAPLFDPAEIDRERGPVIEEMRMRNDVPMHAGYEFIPELLFPGHPLGRTVIGTEETIMGMTAADMRAYYAERYHPGNLVVAVAGQVDHDEVVRQVDQLLGDLSPQQLVSDQPVTTGLSRRLVKAKATKTAQAHMLILGRSYSLSDQRQPAASMMAAILGGGMSSRLFSTIRERQGLAYSVHAGLDSLSDTGVFYAYAGANLELAEQALTSLMAELERIQNEPVDEAELARVQQKRVAGLEMSEESNMGIANTMATQLVICGRLSSLDKRIAKIQAVTVEQVQAAAQDILRPDKLRMALVAPGAAGKKLAATFRGLVA